MTKVSPNKFDGFCEECGSPAEERQSAATALMENQQDRVLSTVGLNLIRCDGGHAYFSLRWDSQVRDPFHPDEPLNTSRLDPIDLEIPPPPPPKEDA